MLSIFYFLYLNYHYIGSSASAFGSAPDKQIFGGIYYWAKESGMFVSHSPDDGMFIQPGIALVGSTHLIEIAYHRPVGNYLDTTNLLTGGGYDSYLGWNMGGNDTSWMGIFLFSIENWHPTNYVSYGSPLTKTSYISGSHTHYSDDAVFVLTGGNGVPNDPNIQGVFRSSPVLVSYSSVIGGSPALYSFCLS